MVDIKVTSLEFIVDDIAIPFGFPVLSAEVKETDYSRNRQFLATRILRSRGVTFPPEVQAYSFKDGLFVYGANSEAISRGDYLVTLLDSEVPAVLKELSIAVPRLNDTAVLAFYDTLNKHPSLDFAPHVSSCRIPGYDLGAAEVNVYVVPSITIEIDLLKK